MGLGLIEVKGALDASPALAQWRKARAIELKLAGKTYDQIARSRYASTRMTRVSGSTPSYDIASDIASVCIAVMSAWIQLRRGA
jgi:hypothetical protein